MIEINPEITLSEADLDERFTLAGGPGGQNVNKVATAVQLRFDVEGSQDLPEPVKERLRALAGNRVDKNGVLLIRARRHRSLEQNRRDARERLAALIRQALEPPKKRKRRRGESRRARARREQAKRRRGETKRLRQRPRLED